MIPGNYCIIVCKMVGSYSILYLILYHVILCLGRVRCQGYPTLCKPWSFGNDHLPRSALKEKNIVMHWLLTTIKHYVIFPVINPRIFGFF